MGRRASAAVLWLVLFAVVAVGAVLYVLIQANGMAAAKTLGMLCGLGVVSSILLGLKSRPRRNASLDREADDFLEKLEQGEERVPDREEPR